MSGVAAVRAAAVGAALAVACAGSGAGGGAGPDTTAPEVASTVPADGATRAARSTPITVTFTEPVDAASLQAGGFTLQQGGVPVAGTVTVSGATASFVPTAPLAYGASYTATVTAGVRDAAGNGLAAAHAFTFSVVAEAFPPSYLWQAPDLQLATDTIRAGQPHGGFVLAQCFADFDADGDTDLLIAPGDGSPNPMPVELYRNDGGSLAYDATGVADPVPGLVHGRKCVVLDADGDGDPDAFVAGHGYDQPPFPGEQPALLLNRSGTLVSAPLPAEALGFNHGAAAGDTDEDGDSDVFVARQGNPFFLVNDGTGRFALDTARVPASLRGNLYTAELIDVDGDSHLDLLTSGHEQDGMASMIFWGDGSGRYSDARRTVLPALAGWGVVIDVDADDLDGDGDRDVVLNRTGDPSGLGFYQGYRLQLLEQTAPRTFVDASDARIPGARSDTDRWITWVRLQDRDRDGDVDVHVEDAGRGLEWVNDGTGQFAPP